MCIKNLKKQWKTYKTKKGKDRKWIKLKGKGENWKSEIGKPENKKKVFMNVDIILWSVSNTFIQKVNFLFEVFKSFWSIAYIKMQDAAKTTCTKSKK
jgi:hypothetical protein